MTTIFAIVITFLIIVFIIVGFFFSIQRKKEKREALLLFANDIFEKKGFSPKEVIILNSSIAVAVNRKNTKLAVVIKNNSSDEYTYEEINSYFITGIEKNSNTIDITYVSNGNKKILNLKNTKQTESLIYELYKNAYVIRLGQKYGVQNFTLTAASDWNCSFVWAYSHVKNIFTYYKTTEKITFYKLNLLKEFFTLDTKYDYFEAPIMGISQQVFVYEKDFLDSLFKYLLGAIRQKANAIVKERLFYDNYSNAVYLSNGINSIQSIMLDKISEVYYQENKLLFTLKESEKEINYITDRSLMEEFSDFVTSYNLRNIANSFNYSTDKLINVTESTKFIFDFTRDRVIYCANLNKFSQFSYITVAFSNLLEAKLEKSGGSHFVRIFTKNKDIIDISCNKLSVAQYIMAQLVAIINK